MAPIRQMLDLSTGHLDEASKEWLSDHQGSVMEGEYGWWTPVYDQPGEEGDELNHPAAIEVIFAFARECGCDCILFDADAPEVEGLPLFEAREAA